jgi:DNA-binding protein H-NS
VEIGMARKKKEPVELSAKEIEEKLAAIKADKKMLEAALKQQRAAELSGFAKEIRDQIIERGYTVEEVFSVLGKVRRKSAGSRRSGNYRQYVDPDNPSNTYSRGPVPVWLKERMIASGYDPADKAQREEFKTSHLKLAV